MKNQWNLNGFGVIQVMLKALKKEEMASVIIVGFFTFSFLMKEATSKLTMKEATSKLTGR